MPDVGFLYYIPAADRTISDADARGAGLDHAFDADARIVKRGVQRNGPDGGAGVLVTDNRRVPDEFGAVNVEAQTWRRIPKTDTWVGYINAHRPTPAALARKNMLSGHDVRMADGSVWHVPVARATEDVDGTPSAYNALPHTVTLDDNGRWTVGETDREYADLWAIASRYWDMFLGAVGESGDDDTAVAFDFDDLHDAAVTALRANYVVSSIEAAMLGLFSSTTARDVLQALIDWPSIDAWLKKKQGSQCAG